MKKRILVAMVVSVAVFGAVFASAASLGLTAETLGADSADVTSCDTAVTTTYATGYVNDADTTPGDGYYVTTVTIGGLETACSSKVAKVTLTDSTGAALESASVTISLATGETSEAVSFTGTTTRAEAVEDIHVVISG